MLQVLTFVSSYLFGNGSQVLASNPFPLLHLLEERGRECTSACPGPIETCSESEVGWLVSV